MGNGAAEIPEAARAVDPARAKVVARVKGTAGKNKEIIMGDEPTLSDVKVTEDVCRRRTDKIIAIQTQTLASVEKTGKKIDLHVAIHKAGEQVKAQGVSKMGGYAKLIGLIITIASLLGMLVWNTATTLKAAEMAEQAAKKVNGD